MYMCVCACVVSMCHLKLFYCAQPNYISAICAWEDGIQPLMS